MEAKKMTEENLFMQVNKAKDLSAPEDLEKKHVPIIEAPDTVKKGEPFEVTIDVGNLMPHPNENAHFIEWIELSAEDVFISRIDLIPLVGKPKVTLNISLEEGHTLRARARCNMHGIWEFEKEVKVE